MWTRLRRAVLVVAALLAANFALWLLAGRRALERGVPAMVRADLRQLGGKAPHGSPIKDIVIVRDAPGALDADVLANLRAASRSTAFELTPNTSPIRR